MSPVLKTFDWRGHRALTAMKPELEEIAANGAVSSVVVESMRPIRGNNASGMAFQGQDGRTGAYVLLFRCPGASQHVKVFPKNGNDANGNRYNLVLGAFLQTHYTQS